MPSRIGRYQISSLGRVHSLRGSGRILKPYKGSKYGHLKVKLGTEGKDEWVHRLVLLAFVGEPAEGQVARHLNGNPADNRLVNLAWGTPCENGADTVTHGRSTRGTRNTRSKLDEDDVREIRRLLGSRPHWELAVRFGVSASTISEIKSGRTWGWLDA